MKITAIKNFTKPYFQPTKNTVCFKGNSETDTFTSSKVLTTEEQKKLNKKHSKIRDLLRKAIWNNDLEGVNAILYSEDVYPGLIHTANRYYDSKLRDSTGIWGNKSHVNPKIGELIYNAELDLKLNDKTQKNPYISIIREIKYGLNKQYPMEVIKKAFKSKDSTLLRLTIDTLKHENKPYAEMLIDAVEQIKTQA